MGREPNKGWGVVLIDEDFVLSESPAIMGYFARKYGPTPLAPEEPRARALSDQWLSWQATELAGGWGYAVMALTRKVPGYDDEAKIDESLTRWTARMRILEAQLAKSRFVAGEAMTVADIAIGLAVHRWFSVDRELKRCRMRGSISSGCAGRARVDNILRRGRLDLNRSGCA